MQRFWKQRAARAIASALCVPLLLLVGDVTAAGAAAEPTLYVGDAQIAELDAESVTITVPVSLSSPAPGPVSMRIGTDSGNATVDDFQPVAKTLTIPAGKTQASLAVKVLGDTDHEPDEVFIVRASRLVGAVTDRPIGVVTIFDDDDPLAEFTGSAVRITGGGIAEGDTTTRLATFMVTAVPAPATDLVLRASTGSPDPELYVAADSDDYDAATKSIRIRAGRSSAKFAIKIQGDSDIESDDYIAARIRRVSGAPATVWGGDATMAIINDDVPVNCDDGDENTYDYYIEATNSCGHIDFTCDDGDPQTIDSFDFNTLTCTHTPSGVDLDGNIGPLTAVQGDPYTQYGEFEVPQDRDCYTAPTTWYPSSIFIYLSSATFEVYDTDGQTVLGVDQVENFQNWGPISTGQYLCLVADTSTSSYVIYGSADEDGDGFPFGSDCDDTDPMINPGAEEVPGNLVDENCDTVILEPPGG